MHDLTGKIALVIGLGQTNTGTDTDTETESWGIGAACAITLSRQGATIFGGNRTLASTHRTISTISREGGHCTVTETDATSSTSVQALVESCVAAHGRIDILVCGVGYSAPGCPATLDEETWDDQVRVNLRSAYLACRFVLPVMERGAGGAVVCVSSIAGMRYIGKPQVAYSAAKAAVMQFVKATAVVYARRGVRLNTVVPGLMETPYTRAMAGRYATATATATGETEGGGGGEKGEGEGGGGDGYEDFKRMREDQVPMGRMGDAWDVANAVLFLVSDEARYITGQKIVVDGGITSSTGRT